MKIIFVIDATFSERDYERFSLKALLEGGFKVELWDLKKLRYNTLSLDKFEKDACGIKRNIFSSFDELNNKSIELDGAFLIDQRSSLYKKYTTCWFQDKGAIIVNFEQGLMPLSIWVPSIMDYLIVLRNKFLNIGFKRTLLDVIKYIFNNFAGKPTLMKGTGATSAVHLDLDRDGEIDTRIQLVQFSETGRHGSDGS